MFVTLLWVCFASCSQEVDKATLAEIQYALNSQMLNENLGQIVYTDTDTSFCCQQLRRYYADSLHERVWTARLLPTHRADTLLTLLRREVKRAGFSERYFQLTQIQEDLDSTRQLNIDSLQPVHLERMARLEYLLSKAYVSFALGQKYGFMPDPEQHFNHLYVRDTTRDGRVLSYRRVFAQGIRQPDSLFVIDALANALNDRAIDFLGSCKPSSALYGQLEEQLPSTTDKAGRMRLLVNMERCRWQHTDRPVGGELHVLVNVAAQQLWAVSTDSVLQMRVVCGARKTKTPLMKSMMTWMIVNPEWHVPANVVRDEISHHGGDSAYFAKHRYYLTKGLSGGERVNPASVSSRQLAANLYRVTQERGAGNSLGRIKFHLDNSFDVYLHDTNNPGAFSRTDRALSHGCVRVQRPFDLACFLLQLTDEREMDRLRVSIGMQPEGEKEKLWLEEHSYEQEKVLNRFGNRRFKPAIPVYIVYYTMYSSPVDGKLQTWGDPYHYDQQVWEQIKPFAGVDVK